MATKMCLELRIDWHCWNPLQTEISPFDDSYYCEICREGIKEGSTLQRCVDCDYCLCQCCFAKAAANDARQDLRRHVEREKELHMMEAKPAADLEATVVVQKQLETTRSDGSRLSTPSTALPSPAFEQGKHCALPWLPAKTDPEGKPSALTWLPAKGKVEGTTCKLPWLHWMPLSHQEKLRAAMVASKNHDVVFEHQVVLERETANVGLGFRMKKLKSGNRVIIAVEQGSVAHGKLKQSDILTHIGGQDVKTSQNLVDLIGQTLRIELRIARPVRSMYSKSALTTPLRSPSSQSTRIPSFASQSACTGDCTRPSSAASRLRDEVQRARETQNEHDTTKCTVGLKSRSQVIAR